MCAGKGRGSLTRSESTGNIILEEDEVMFFVGVHGHGPRPLPDELTSVVPCEAGYCSVSLAIKSPLNTSLNSVQRNFKIICLNSKEKGGPFKILMREDTSVSTEKELRKDG